MKINWMLSARAKYLYISKVINSCQTKDQVIVALNLVYNWHTRRGTSEAGYIASLYDLAETKGRQLITKKFADAI